MAKKFEYTLNRRIINPIMAWLIRNDRAPERYYLLTVPGRKTGLPRTVPIVLVEEDGQRWLVAPYGEVQWLRNARAARQITLQHGSTTETLTFTQLTPEESASVLKTYLIQNPITAPYFDASPDSPAEVFIKEARTKPVFILHST